MKFYIAYIVRKQIKFIVRKLSCFKKNSVATFRKNTRLLKQHGLLTENLNDITGYIHLVILLPFGVKICIVKELHKLVFRVQKQRLYTRS